MRELRALLLKNATGLGRYVSDWKRNHEEDDSPMQPWNEPDWEELDRKANGIIARYAVVSGAWNIAPPPLIRRTICTPCSIA